MSMLLQAAIFLAAAVVALPIARRLGLGAIVGYLLAGVVLGPQVTGLVGAVEDVFSFAQFGVVLLLFVIGLELQPTRLWTMRRLVFGLGAAQIAATGAIGGSLALLLGLDPLAAGLVGVVLALSATPLALQMLAEKGQLVTRFGRMAFAVLLFQDLAAIPLLAMIPVMAGGIDGIDGWGAALAVLEVLGVLAAFVLVARYVLRVALRIVAATRVPEALTAMALLVVIGAALLMDAMGLSMALGAFISGVLLADSEYRHELEADIDPFKNLLLGLFFIAVGMSIDLRLVLAEPAATLGLVAALMLVKGLILYGLGRLARLADGPARSFAIALSPGGEFAFVLFAVAASAGVVAEPTANRLILVVALSMLAMPLASRVNDLLGARRKAPREPQYDRPPPDERHVIIAGFGRFGQIVGRLLRAKGIRFTALDISPEHISFIGRFGIQAYFGDASRLDLLRAAQADKASAFVLAIDEVEASLRTARVVRRHFPELPVYARARNRQHVYRLMELGVTVIQRETFLSSLELGRELLTGLGLSERESARIVARFRENDEKRLRESFAVHDDEAKLLVLARKAAEELETLLAAETAEEVEPAPPPPKRRLEDG